MSSRRNTLSTDKASRCYFPVRFQLAILLFFGTCSTYMIKTNMSLTMVAMINKTALRMLENDCSIPSDPWCFNVTRVKATDESSCPFPESSVLPNTTGKEVEKTEGSFVWKSDMQGVIVGSLLYGFASTNIIGGRLADRFGPKWFIGGGILLGSILTSLVPIVAELGEWYLVALRVVTGMTQGCILPCIAALYKRWVPQNERTRFYSICNSGSYIGMAVCMPMVGYLCQQTTFANGWPSVFYTIGIIGTSWSLLWMLLAQNDPSTHPRISTEEREYIMDNLQVFRAQNQNHFPWKAILTSIRVWMLIITWLVGALIFWVRVTELPNYLDQVLHLPIKQNGYVNALANVCPLVMSLFGGFAADYLISRQIFTKTTVRKIFECFVVLGSCGFLLLVTVIGCDHQTAIAFLILSSGFLGFSSCSISVLVMDMAPTLSGTLFGIGTTFSSLIGFACPTIVGVLLGMRGTPLLDKWHYVFYFTSGSGLFGLLVAILSWKAEVQPWDPSFRFTNHSHSEHPSTRDDQELVSNEQSQKF